MRIEDIEDQEIVEAVTIEELRKYIGYAPGNSADDDYLSRLIVSQRQALEDAMGRIIVLRDFVSHPSRDGAVCLPPDLQTVDSITYKDADGEEKEVTDFELDLEYNVVVFDIRGEYSDIRLEFSSGFGIIPESIKEAIMVMCKSKYDRSTEDTLAMVRPPIQKYWVEHI